MKNFRVSLVLLVTLTFVFSLENGQGQPTTPEKFPEFKEIYDLLRTNLPEIKESELNRAAVSGLLDRLRSQVILVTNAPGESAATLLRKTAVFDDAFGYLRVGQVEAGLAKEFRSAYDELRAKQKLSGLVLDLRFASGVDYAAATGAADLFFTSEQLLFKWSDSMARATGKSNAVRLPVAVLINRQTTGAAEALAAAVRQAEVSITIGSPTSGQARLFKDFTLSTGQHLKVASGVIETADGQAISGAGVSPDIRIVVSPEDEKAYFDDPYKSFPRPFAQSVRMSSTNDLATLLGTNRPPRRRLNESELIRMQREGFDIDREPPPAGREQSSKPVVNDPALARALDFLKGVALVQNRR